MFEDYVNNKKKQQQTKKYSLDNRRYSNMNIPNITKTGLSNENYRRYSAEKIFVSPEN